MCTICQSFRPFDSGCVYSEQRTETANIANTPTFSYQQIADQLTTDFWVQGGYGGPRQFSPDTQSISVNITKLTSAGQTLARNALDAWAEVTGIRFTYTSGSAQIDFDDNQSGAFASYSVSGGTILSARVNISTSWLNFYGTTLDSYSFQTYIHEIGHALGLGHAGFYNGSARYGSDNHYANDSWQATVMSYFSQAENAAVPADYAFTVTPMVADVIAVQDLYGYHAANPGSTVYGVGSTAGGYMDAVFAELTGTGNSGLIGNQPMAFTITDGQGRDTIDFSTDTANQRVDLAPGGISDVYGLRGNMLIDVRTQIEKYFAGSGNDVVEGNGANNVLRGRQGVDTLFGFNGNDHLVGGGGTDTLWGGTGNDLLEGGSGNDGLRGEAGDDRLVGQSGSDQLIGGDGDDRLEGMKGRDSLFGGAGNDMLFGGEGVDWLNGQAGADLLRGGKGKDTLLGGNGGDTLIGESGGDLLEGQGGNDDLSGGNGADRLIGGIGNDTLSGGGGIDQFVFLSGDGADTITDFQVSLDKIDVSGVSSNLDFADITASAANSGTGVLMTIEPGLSIRLDGVTVIDLSADMFIF